MLKKLAPVFIVEAIEPSLVLWESLGFVRTAEVPHEGQLGFVILERDGLEVMYQTVGSVQSDHAAIVSGPRTLGAAAIFIEVTDLEEMRAALPQGTDLVVASRQTFYGSTEMILRDPAGNVITFAQFS